MRKRKRWLPKGRASRRKASFAGVMEGSGSRKIVLHTSESSPGSIDGVVNWIVGRNISYHLVIDDKLKKAVQLYPFDKAARSLLNGGINNGIGCNRSGAVCIQICVVGYAKDRPIDSLSPWAVKLLRDIADSWGVPLKVRKNPKRSVSNWLNRSGFFTHAGAPGNDHHDPGRFKKRKLERRLSPSTSTVKPSEAVTEPSSPTVAPKKKRKARVTKNKDTKWPTDKRLMRKIRKLSKRSGYRIHIRSGYRSIEEQAALYRGYINGWPGYNLAAPPGRSRHNYGTAADMGWIGKDGKYRSIGYSRKCRRIMKDLKLCLPVPGEPWHTENGTTWRA